MFSGRSGGKPDRPGFCFLEIPPAEDEYAFMMHIMHIGADAGKKERNREFLKQKGPVRVVRSFQSNRNEG